MIYIALGLFAAGIIALDQITKFFTTQHYRDQFIYAVEHIADAEFVPLEASPIRFWDGILQFRFVANDGMGFSMLEGFRWFFVVMTIAALVLIVFAYRKKWVNHPTGYWALASVAGGAIGNLIDRIRFGFVVDMIEVKFIDFPVFNVADCFIVCGAILLLIYAFFFDKKEEKLHDTDCGQSQ